MEDAEAFASSSAAIFSTAVMTAGWKEISDSLDGQGRLPGDPPLHRPLHRPPDAAGVCTRILGRLQEGRHSQVRDQPLVYNLRL